MCYNVPLCVGRSKIKLKQGCKFDVPALLQLVIPWENKPLIQTCNQCHSSLYRQLCVQIC